MRAALLLVLLLPAPGEGGPVSGAVTLPEGGGARNPRLKLRYVGQTGLGEKKPAAPSPAVVYLEDAPASRSSGKIEEIVQQGLEFRPRVLAVQTGTTVRFPNGDDLYHNVFSYSPVKRFDLGRYPKGESKEVLFDRKGRVDVFCELHEHMRAFILVVDNPHFAVCRADGTFEIPGVPPGKYTLVAWHERFEALRRPIEVGAGGAKVELRFAREPAPPGGGTGGGLCCGTP
jgi:plastocyanin